MYNIGDITIDVLYKMISKSKVIKKSYIKLLITVWSFICLVFWGVSYSIKKEVFSSIFFIQVLLGVYILVILIYMLCIKRLMRNIAKVLLRVKDKERDIELEEEGYVYKTSEVNINLKKDTVKEVIQDKYYTMLIIKPLSASRFKYNVIVVLNSIFKTQENYESFIQDIT